MLCLFVSNDCDFVFVFVCCSDEQTFETKTVYVGENINLTCPRRDVGTLFWLKLVSGDFPKILGRSFSSQSADQRIRTVTDPGIFDLYITKAQQSDTGVYICMKTANRELTFLNGTYLKVQDSCKICKFTLIVCSFVHGGMYRRTTDEDLLVYSAPTFKKASKSGTKDTKPAEEESIYTDVKALGLD
uniref:Immunoglobulin domain-containing protein n=1 Tax=Pundamilia nyererei TaxID=303518 RepID=A0A3B4FZG1_9CICH